MYENKSTMRYRIRNTDPSLREHFFPWGLLGLLLILLPLLYALFLYAKNTIERTVRTEITEELAKQDLDWVNVDVDGQWVTLSGQGPKQEGDKALSIGKKLVGPAFMGRFAVPSKVSGSFTEPAKVAAKPVVKPAVAKPVWGRMIGNLDKGVLTLAGTVGSQAEKDALIGAANRRLDPPRLARVIDKVQVTKVSLNPASAVLAKRVGDLVAACGSGQASSIEGVYSIECQAKREQVDSLDASARELIRGANIGRIAISSSNECNESFVKILDGKSIGFAVGSANLKASSAPLLDQIADLAKSCPGSIRVEGHTDKSGSLEANMALSNARATAVVSALVERGVNGDRLSPQGFGPTKPRAGGDSREAYALNRRIEFHVSQ